MNRFLKLLVLMPLLSLVTSCTNDDEPVIPEFEGVVENDFFTNLITSAETRYFDEYYVAEYVKADSESNWRHDDEAKLGGTGRDSFLFYRGRLYLRADFSPFDFIDDFEYLKLLYSFLSDEIANLPYMFVASQLSYDKDNNLLSYDYYTERRLRNVISAGGDKFRLSYEGNYISSEGNGTTLYINDYVESHRFSDYELNQAKFFNSWKDVANYLADLAEEKYGADYKLHGVGPSISEIRAFYSTDLFEAK